MIGNRSNVLDPLRLQLADGIRMLLTGTTAARTHEFNPDETYWFGPDSVVWLVHGDLAMLVGGLRALLLQTLHPLAMAGVAEHSDYRADPLGRLRRTGAFLAATTFGTATEAEHAVARVRRIHDQVVGSTPDGTRYEANNPHLLAWVHCTEVDSFLVAHNRYARNALIEDAGDRYVAEMAQVGTRVGVVSPPMSTMELAWRLEAYRPELCAGVQARRTVRFLLAPPLPIAVRPMYAVIAAAAVSLLPRYAQSALLLALPPGVEPTVVRPATAGLLRLLNWSLSATDQRS